MEGTAALRGAAPRWSLAGDQQLLDLLQEIHQRIISKCNETNKRLDEMSKGLRDASVNLQNVNNKFLALSNTQFVESRVYEDDADVTPPAVEKKPPKPKDLASDLSKLKRSLQLLESYHEPLLIARDSDSDTDSDDNDDRLVLKPKDLYADRPLPYIIGSQAWRSKWHAGLVPDESDSDSSTSKVEEVEQYSESEDETPAENYMPDRTMSASMLSLESEAPVSVSPVRPSPAAVAADLARRLGGDIKHIQIEKRMNWLSFLYGRTPEVQMDFMNSRHASRSSGALVTSLQVVKTASSQLSATVSARDDQIYVRVLVGAS